MRTSIEWRLTGWILLGLLAAPPPALAQQDTMPDGTGFNQPVVGADRHFHRDAAAAAASRGEAPVQQSAPTYYYWDPYYVPPDGTLLPASVPGEHQYQPADTHMPERASSSTVTDRAIAGGAITGEAVRGGAVTGRVIGPEPWFTAVPAYRDN